jgi:P27 family predicted phage terminase small subunit
MKKPKHLNPKAFWKYEELEKIIGEQMKEGDENLLAILANSYITYRDANQELIDHGIVLGGQTMKRGNPAVNVLRDTIKIIESLTSHFGLSPKARKDNMNREEKKKDALDKLLDE